MTEITRGLDRMNEHKVELIYQLLMDNDLTALHNYAARTDRLASTPTPVSYNPRHISRGLIFGSFSSPRASRAAAPALWVLVPGALFVSWLTLGIDDIGMQLEQPFTVLAVKEFCEECQAEVEKEMLESAWTPRIGAPRDDVLSSEFLNSELTAFDRAPRARSAKGGLGIAGCEVARSGRIVDYLVRTPCSTIHDAHSRASKPHSAHKKPKNADWYFSVLGTTVGSPVFSFSSSSFMGIRAVAVTSASPTANAVIPRVAPQDVHVLETVTASEIRLLRRNAAKETQLLPVADDPQLLREFPHRRRPRLVPALDVPRCADVPSAGERVFVR